MITGLNRKSEESGWTSLNVIIETTSASLVNKHQIMNHGLIYALALDILSSSDVTCFVSPTREKKW
jgi:hypothetical protein